VPELATVVTLSLEPVFFIVIVIIVSTTATTTAVAATFSRTLARFVAFRFTLETRATECA
jgi:hypothetical protein